MLLNTRRRRAKHLAPKARGSFPRLGLVATLIGTTATLLLGIPTVIAILPDAPVVLEGDISVVVATLASGDDNTDRQNRVVAKSVTKFLETRDRASEGIQVEALRKPQVDIGGARQPSEPLALQIAARHHAEIVVFLATSDSRLTTSIFVDRSAIVNAQELSQLYPYGEPLRAGETNESAVGGFGKQIADRLETMVRFIDGVNALGQSRFDHAATEFARVAAVTDVGSEIPAVARIFLGNTLLEQAARQHPSERRQKLDEALSAYSAISIDGSASMRAMLGRLQVQYMLAAGDCQATTTDHAALLAIVETLGKARARSTWEERPFWHDLV